jgi:hypothetical protein
MRSFIIVLLALSTGVLAVPAVPAVNLKVSQVLEHACCCRHNTDTTQIARRHIQESQLHGEGEETGSLPQYYMFDSF